MNDVLRHIMELVASEPDEASKRLLELIKYHQDYHQADACRQEYEEIILSTGLYRSAEHDFNKGLIRRDDREITFQRVRVSILNIIERIPKRVFDLPEGVKKQLLADKLKKDELSEKASLIASQSRHEYDLFFSFSSANIEAAKTVVARLRGHGLRVFFSDETLKHRVGESFDKMINHALENSSHFVWFCTPESAASSWVELEYTAFFNHVHLPDQRNRKFFILRGKDFEIKHVPITYRTRQFADDEEQIIGNLPKVEETDAPTETVRAKPDPGVEKWEKERQAAAEKEVRRRKADTEERLRWERLLEEKKRDEEQLAALEKERVRLEAEARELRLWNERVEAKKKQEEERLAARAKEVERRETEDHHTFFLARTIAEYENYLEQGHTLHEKEARDKIAELKQQELARQKEAPPPAKRGKRDYYEVLGVSKNAAPEELKKAFEEKKRAIPPDSETGAELLEAHRVLSDTDLRRKYDRYGHALEKADLGRFEGMTMDDIFREFGFDTVPKTKPCGPKGSNLRIKMNVTANELEEGFEKKIRMKKQVACTRCGATGALDGKATETCKTCRGAGGIAKVTDTPFGKMNTNVPCKTCDGVGLTITKKCKTCNGTGQVQEEVVIPVSVSKENLKQHLFGEHLISMSGLGNAGFRGGPPGDLLITLNESG